MFDEVVIHSLGININGVFLAEYNDLEFGRKVDGIQVAEDKEEELIRIYVGQQLRPGIYILMIDFDANLSDSFWGFYKSSWIDENGWKNEMATTQFSPYWARTAWPCYDEPRFKAR